MIENEKDILDQNEEDLVEDTEEVEEDIPDNTQIFDGTDIEDEVMPDETYEEEESEDTGAPKGPKKDTKKILIPIIIAAIVILVVLIFVMLNGRNNSPTGTTPSTSPSPSATTENIDWEAYAEIWDERHAINSDYIGEIRFESGLIDLPVVQYIDPNNSNAGYEKYLRTDWETMEYDEEGSIFVDPFSDLTSSTNITLYGHYVYPSYEPSMTHKFTPLVKLMEEENYEANKYVYLVLENEVRKYEIAHVYIAQQYDNPLAPLEDGMYYMLPDWTDEELEYYEQRMSEIDEYDTGVTLEPGDKFLTLQTCVEGRDDQKQIVVAKEVEVFSYR